MKAKAQSNWRLRDFVESLFWAVLLAVFVRTFLFTAYRIPTTSMAPTLRPGDFVFSNRIVFGLRLPWTNFKIGGRMPERGELVVFKYPDKPQVTYVKRVVGLPGDHLLIKDSQVFLNDEKLVLDPDPSPELQTLPGFDFVKVFRETLDQRSYSVMYSLDSKKEAGTFGPFIVPPGQIFLLGDNRDASDDSRYWGTVPIEKIEAKIFLIWLSMNIQSGDGSDLWPSVRRERLFQWLD